MSDSNAHRPDQELDLNYHIPALKICLVGNSSVGKTACLLRFFDNTFTPSVVSTVGIDFRMKTIFLKDTKFRVQCWDTAGQERYRSLIRCYFRGASGCLLVYDISDEHSFLSVQDWAMEVQQQSNTSPKIVLIGNKSDLEERRVISYEDGKKLAEELGIFFYETSAKVDSNIREAFTKLIELIAQTVREDPTELPGNTQTNTERIDLTKDQRKVFHKNNCCTHSVIDLSGSIYNRLANWKKS